MTGKLSPEGIDRAIPALRRFRALCRQMHVTETFAVATAAAREASNGAQFIKQAEETLGAPIKVLTGKQEAGFAARGVIAGIPGANGVVGDLGGGSLELIDVKNGKLRDGVTLPLGALRLIDVSGGSIEKAKSIVDKAFKGLNILNALEGRAFYAVGGTWRNLARLHMSRGDYPLSVIHQYRIAASPARELAREVSAMTPEEVVALKAVSKSRSETLPFGALVLDRLLATSGASHVETSVLGVREGLIYANLSRPKRDRDPLLASCWDFSRRYARSPEHELELCDWTDDFIASLDHKETQEQRRLRHAACLLSDIGWKAHPDYRGSRSLNLISQAAFVGVDHPGRIFLALTIYYRYQGLFTQSAPKPMVKLVTEANLAHARLIAGALRLAYILSAAMPGVLPKMKLRQEGGKTLVLGLPKKLADLEGERVAKRLDHLAGILELNSGIRVG